MFSSLSQTDIIIWTIILSSAYVNNLVHDKISLFGKELNQATKF